MIHTLTWFLAAPPPETSTPESTTTTTVVEAVSYGVRETWFNGTAFASGAVVALVLWLTLVMRAEGGDTT